MSDGVEVVGRVEGGVDVKWTSMRRVEESRLLVV